MSERILLATFDYEDDLLGATAEVHKQGYSIVDVFTPHAVHGLDRAMGLKQSRLTWVCFLCGALGLTIALAFQHWSAAVSWAINVGGKPWNSLPSDAPVAFELLVLFASFGSVLALFAVCRLFPGKKALVVDVRATDDKYILVLEEADAAFDVATLRTLLDQYHVSEMREQLSLEG